MPQLLLYDNQRRLWPAGLVCTTSTSSGIINNKDSSNNHLSSLVVLGGGGGGAGGKVMGPCLKRGLGEANSLFELQLSNNQYDDILDMEDDDGLNAIMMSNGGAGGMGSNGVMGGVGGSSKKAKRLSGEQVKALETAFDADNKLEAERKVQLAGEVGLQPRQVAIWFQNRRARWKTKQMEIDYSTLKAKYDALLADRDHLLKQKDSLQHQVALLKNRIPGSDSLSEPAGGQATKTEGEEGGGGGGCNDNGSQDYDDVDNNNNIKKNSNCIKEVDFDININNNDNSSYYNNKDEEVNNCSTSNGANEGYDDVDDDVSEESSGIVNGDSPSSQFLQLPTGRYSRVAAGNNTGCQGQRKTGRTGSCPLLPLPTPVSTFTGTQFRSPKAATSPYEDTGDPFALLNW